MLKMRRRRRTVYPTVTGEGMDVVFLGCPLEIGGPGFGGHPPQPSQHLFPFVDTVFY